MCTNFSTSKPQNYANFSLSLPLECLPIFPLLRKTFSSSTLLPSPFVRYCYGNEYGRRGLIHVSQRAGMKKSSLGGNYLLCYWLNLLTKELLCPIWGKKRYLRKKLLKYEKPTITSFCGLGRDAMIPVQCSRVSWIICLPRISNNCGDNMHSRRTSYSARKASDSSPSTLTTIELNSNST